MILANKQTSIKVPFHGPPLYTYYNLISLINVNIFNIILDMAHLINYVNITRQLRFAHSHEYNLFKYQYFCMKLTFFELYQ